MNLFVGQINSNVISRLETVCYLWCVLQSLKKKKLWCVLQVDQLDQYGSST